MIRREEVAARLRLDPELACAALTRFLRDAVEMAGARGLVVGVSGGVDSALAVALAVRGLGRERVHGFFLPYRESDPSSRVHALEVAASVGLVLREIDITPQIDAYFEREEPDADRVRRGNKLARERMSVLFDQAKKLGCLVLGTSNKTEILLGYSTVFGDNASSLNPNGDLWPGQSSESELGFDYALADEVLYLLFDQGLSAAETIERGYPEPVVSKIVERERTHRFKRRLMLIARLSGSAVNLDREIPRD